MWEPTKCCCCCDVRTGSIVISVIILVGGSFSILGGIQTLAGDKSDIVVFCQDEEDPPQCEETFWNIEKSASISSLVTACFHIIFSSFLLYGILKKKTAFFIPLMVVYVIQIGIMILASVVALILLMYAGIPFGGITLLAAIMGSLIFLETYCLLVIRAYYYQLKREKGHVHTALNDRHVESPPYPASECPPYPVNEVPPYPSCGAPLYPSEEKFPK